MKLSLQAILNIAQAIHAAVSAIQAIQEGENVEQPFRITVNGTKYDCEFSVVKILTHGN